MRRVTAGRGSLEARRLIAQVLVRIEVHLALLGDARDDAAPAQANVMMRKSFVGHQLERRVAVDTGGKRSIISARPTASVTPCIQWFRADAPGTCTWDQVTNAGESVPLLRLLFRHQ